MKQGEAHCTLFGRYSTMSESTQYIYIYSTYTLIVTVLCICSNMFAVLSSPFVGTNPEKYCSVAVYFNK